MTIRVAFFLVSCAILAAITPCDSPSVKTEKSFLVAGCSIRTTNANELSGRGRIGKLWQIVQQQNLGAAIPNRVDQNVVVVYANYIGDERGEFNYLLGARVSSVHNLPPQLAYRKVVPGRYATLTTAKGPLLPVLQAAWRKVWSTPQAELGGRRAFATDYEIYDQRAADPKAAQVEIHVGMKDHL